MPPQANPEKTKTMENTITPTSQEVRFKKVKTLKDIKAHPAVESIEWELNDYACWLKDGYLFSTTDAHCTFAPTLAEIADDLNTDLVAEK